MNVIENAIKYNRESGSIKISLDIEEDYCVITCSDTGLGIPQEDIDKVFERFYRVDKSHSQQMGGSGLGLAIVRQAVEMQDGTVSIDSTEGVGTVVTIKVPLVVVAGSEEGGQM
jgi:signal transduction histidine kinase